MNQERSELNKTMQAQLKKEATFSDGITTLLTLRQKCPWVDSNAPVSPLDQAY